MQGFQRTYEELKLQKTAGNSIASSKFSAYLRGIETRSNYLSTSGARCRFQRTYEELKLAIFFAKGSSKRVFSVPTRN